MKKIGPMLLVASLLFSLFGCATVSRQTDLSLQGLRNQIAALETQVQAKDEEINNLRQALAQAEEAKVQNKGVLVSEAKKRPTTKEIQTALIHAGFNPGRIDGRMGSSTREAIRAFQKANNLVPDGRVGKETWDLLKEYLRRRLK